MLAKIGRQLHKEQMERMDKENEALEIKAKYNYREVNKPLLTRLGKFVLRGGAIAYLFTID